MKLILAIVAALMPINTVIAGEYQPGFSSTRTCTRNEYREEYVPGTKKSPGYVRHWNETVEVPCDSRTVKTNPTQNHGDTNDCSEGSLIGGLLGAGLATSGSRGKDRWWAIPAGAVGGAMLGCQIDGG